MRHELKFKNFNIESHKAEKDSQLIISGWAARFGNVDSYGDVIQYGAFTKTLQERKERIAFCYQHEIDEPIGKILLLEEKPEGLWIEVVLSAAEDDIQTKVKEGILKEMSIGYRTINASPSVVDGTEIWNLTELKLYEVSLVTIAANPLATIEAMKSDEKKTHFEKSFERLISSERSDSKKYELMKLKSTVIALIDSQPESKTTDSDGKPLNSKVEGEGSVLTKEEILKLLS